jgi:hypothetical protein
VRILTRVAERCDKLASAEEKAQAARVLMPGIKMLLRQQKFHLGSQFAGPVPLPPEDIRRDPNTGRYIFDKPLYVPVDMGVDVRLAALQVVRALGGDTPDVVPALLHALNEIPQYRSEALKLAAGEYPSPDRLEVAYPEAILKALAEFGPHARDAVEALGKIVAGELGNVKVAVTVRVAAVQALGAIGVDSPATRDALDLAELSGDASLERAAQEARRKIGQ